MAVFVSTIAGVPANQQGVFNKGPLTFWQVLPSIIMLVIPVIIFIMIIVFLIKGVRSKHISKFRFNSV